ncbi:MAG: MBL fold metallo-hydrolase [Candidatus Pacebacteria bacterium]|nr:MBL fold metallo-hydrolase [Candidatus Paceibacterota bacterium]
MLKLTFFGGAQEVTGANYLLEYHLGEKKDQPIKILVDCGLLQGTKEQEEKNREPFKYLPGEIDFLFITHAHLDHIGRIPQLVKNGFAGRIISTAATKDLSELSLSDSLNIFEKEAAKWNIEPIYSKEDITEAMRLWETVEYEQQLKLEGFTATLREAGHILGSAMIEFNIEGKKIVFTGDLGNFPAPLLRAPYNLSETDYLIIESAYGNKEHEDKESRKMKVERAIEKVVSKNGVLMIPSFSVERTQELLFEINDLVENKHIPSLPVFLDSPMAIRATEIYKRYEKYFNKEAQYVIDSGDDIFKFPGLKMTLKSEESKVINSIPPPKIIMAGSGMSTGGRIIHHEKRYLPDPNSTLLIAGYQTAGTLGRHLSDGAKEVEILGERIPVNAEILPVSGYSAHLDAEGLYSFIEKIADRAEKIFVVQGEPAAACFLTQRVRDCLGADAVAPKIGDSFELV